MKIKIYQVDAFTNKLFSGNPAAVCPLEEWLPEEKMQCIATENNLSETAFFVRKGDRFHIRWFTPALEVDLCGHATLASAHVIFNHLNYAGDEIKFDSKSGILKVRKEGNMLLLNFPTDEFKEVLAPEALVAGFGKEPMETHKGKWDYLLVFSSQKEIENLDPNFFLLRKANVRGIIVTAKGSKVDFVSRFFAPRSGVPEDPVTGSSHTTLIPYWAQKLGKKELTAKQLSKRRGKLKCRLLDDRVEIGGEAVTYMIGEIEI
ncbi:MAG TPA: PhzF family phenazine biosynthesis protein [Ignavibacteria bacterium]|jgi:PhzF family phenazine biosynthesis protein